MLVTELGIEMEVRCLPVKAPPMIFVILFGIEYAPSKLEGRKTNMSFTIIGLVSLSQPQKASLPMLVTELGMETEVSSKHCPKANSSMLTTKLGMVMEVSERQPENAACPMIPTDLGMVMEVRPLQS